MSLIGILEHLSSWCVNMPSCLRMQTCVSVSVGECEQVHVNEYESM